jgi:hypothetical protein
VTHLLGPLLGGFGVLIAGFVALVIVAAVVGSRRERERLRQLEQAAFMAGWRPVGGPVPPVVAEATRSRRNKMALAIELNGRPYWMVWHRWTESNGENSRRVDLTRYFAWLGPSYPNLEIKRRTKLGGKLMPVRGLGTGDPAFDKAFLVRSPPDPQTARLLGPQLRQEMLAYRLPPWQIAGGVLIMAYNDAPDIKTLEPRTATIRHLANMLS